MVKKQWKLRRDGTFPVMAKTFLQGTVKGTRRRGRRKMGRQQIWDLLIA